MMTSDSSEQVLRANIKVTTQHVLISKALIASLAGRETRSEELIAEVLKANAINDNKKVILHESLDIEANLKEVALAISWKLAAAEAIWSLVHSGVLFPFNGTQTPSLTVDWTTVVGSGGGHSSGWRFDDYAIPIPERVRRSHINTGQSEQFLSDPDLYLQSFNLDHCMHPDVESAFREAVRCFREELYTAAMAMLGKASEGAWLELGGALLKLVPTSQETKCEKQRSILESSRSGTMQKIEAVIAVYNHQDIFCAVAKQSEVTHKELQSISVWSDAVRDSRNTIHFGVSPAVPNKYEKVAALLIGAVPYIRNLYRIKQAADAEYISKIAN